MTTLVITLFKDMSFYSWTVVDFGLAYNFALQLLRMCSEYNIFRYAVTVVTVTVILTVTVTVTVIVTVTVTETLVLLVFTFYFALIWPTW